MTRTTLFAFSAVALVAAGATAAAPLSGNRALAVAKQRESNMKSFGDATKIIYNNLQSSSPDIGAIRQQAAKINALAPKLLSWFPAGTAVGVGESRAKPEIWQKPEDFAIKAHDFQTAAQQFEVASKTGDVGQIKPAFLALGKSCKACHDPYRAPENH